MPEIVLATLPEEIARAESHDIAPEALREQLTLVERIAGGDVPNGPLAAMSQSARFHWLTTPRSTAVKPGPIHGGMSDDPDATFEHLYATLVERRPSDGPQRSA